MAIKISKKVWDSLNKVEKEYILQRAETDGLSWCKMVISEARKQLPNFTKIYGYTFVEQNGNLYNFSGSDTRKFRKVTNGTIMF